MQEVSYITSNPDKAAHMTRLLGREIKPVTITIPEIQSLDLNEVVKEKAKAAFDILQQPLFVDDVSLQIDSLGKLPGPFIKFFLSEIGAQGICDIIDANNRKAIGQAALGFHDGNTVHVFYGEVVGSIARNQAGNNGFGWDRLFIPDGHSITRGEMQNDAYDKTSPRRIALEKFKVFLENKS